MIEIIYREAFGLTAAEYEEEPANKIEEYITYQNGLAKAKKR